jgi:hypothetical protein
MVRVALLGVNGYDLLGLKHFPHVPKQVCSIGGRKERRIKAAFSSPKRSWGSGIQSPNIIQEHQENHSALRPFVECIETLNEAQGVLRSCPSRNVHVEAFVHARMGGHYEPRVRPRLQVISTKHTRTAQTSSGVHQIAELGKERKRVLMIG